MADRSFNIQEMLASQGVKVNVHPFINESGQFNESELLGKRRIRAERAMKRIKKIHTLGFVPITLCKNGISDVIFCLCNASKVLPTTSRWLAITMIFPSNIAYMLSVMD